MLDKSTILPLHDKRVLVTRTRAQASALSAKLRALGALPIEFPTIRIVPPQPLDALDHALQQLYAPAGSDYDWWVLTSANGVHICCERLHTLGCAFDTLHDHVRIATIGPATAATLQQYGLTTDLLPDEYIAESVVTALLGDAQAKGKSLAGSRILLTRAAETRKVLVTDLQRAGAIVDEVAAYHTLPVSGDDAQGKNVLSLLQQRQLDILTFTSSSTVRNFVAWFKSCEQANAASLQPLQPVIACIGPITAQTARELGLSVTIEAKEFTTDGLVDAIVDYAKN
ncbi:MAG TPA: uroporphyrinogen-III synthase [Ktedonobacteraceae bacterium]|jgi:uroporphyrinogen III methyltransferase/synthase|nr:uroporphyrinogen-III synthase [Ktedonobacteraceae bacterium]